MVGIVGYLRTFAALALVLSTVAHAGEPLTVTRLPDAEKLLVTYAASDDRPDYGTGEFSRVISEAVRAQQLSIQAKCRAAPAPSGAIEARWAWEARCRYRRY